MAKIRSMMATIATISRSQLSPRFDIVPLMINRFLFTAILTGTAILSAADGFKPLFNGKTLKGWEGDPRLWKVENGVLVGSTDGVTLQDNTFLIYRAKEFSDFDLKLKVKLRNHNSGIQFRSEELPNFVVKGLQADMAEGNWWGSIYDEKASAAPSSTAGKTKPRRL
jgi:hypothetical protein